MSDQTKLIIILSLIVVAVVLILIIIFNTRKANLKKEIEDVHVRFNKIKTIPLAFKLNKAQAIAKRNAETADKVKIYYDKFEEAQKHIDQISSMLETIEDAEAAHNYKEVKETLEAIKVEIENSEKEVNDIDHFLQQFSEEETVLREESTKLKEKFRKIKLYVNDNAKALSIAYEGIEKKIERVEDLFSQSEEYMYINDYDSSKKAISKIKDSILDIERCVLALPEVLADTKGVVPALLDEVARQYALNRQRGVFTDHLKVDEELDKLNSSLNEDIRTLSEGNLGEVKEHNEAYKEKLNGLMNALNNENKDFQALKSKSDEIVSNINELKTIHNYVKGAYGKDKERFGIEDIDKYLEESERSINEYQASYISLNQEILDNHMPASELTNQANQLIEEIENDKKELAKYKATFDKNTTDEQRAHAQLMKLQVVLNEVEVKVLEYHLPAIADSYKDDLIKGREKVAKIKGLLTEVPLNFEELNKVLDESIDFIYTFYNNVNNVVGMAIMVENAIVFGNKYRSSHPEVERDLSRAEFSYLNGEYTKALTMAIACMERLFPNRKSSSYLENA